MKRPRVGVIAVLVACIVTGTILFAGNSEDEQAGSIAETRNFGMSFDVVPDGNDYVMTAQFTNLEDRESTLRAARVRTEWTARDCQDGWGTGTTLGRLTRS